MDTMTIYLVQHAEKERIPGDPSITELGELHAGRTGVWATGPRHPISRVLHDPVRDVDLPSGDGRA
jgi:hypothetical protein